MTTVRPIRHPVAVSVVAVLAVIGTGIGIIVVRGNAALRSAKVAPSVLATIAHEQSFSYSAAPPGTVPRVTVAEAISSNASVPAHVVAAQLLEIRGPMTNDRTMLVWAIQDSLPNGSGLMGGGPAGSVVPHRSFNFRIDFVNANSDRLVFATEGHAPSVATGG